MSLNVMTNYFKYIFYRKFMNSIRPEDSSEDDLSSDESRPRNRRRHGGQKKVIKAPSNTNLGMIY